ncbi:hypothetical protein CHISP_3213 [Chitinispirillum alkaliphilum]|nr:hypothetical protein CHISP_3213 [Chitinispirillum alkaliphilum]
MASVRENAIRLLQSLPDDSSVEDIMEELYFKLVVDNGLKELDEGKGIAHEEVENRLAKWLKK